MEKRPLKLRKVSRRCPRHSKVSPWSDLLSLPDDVLWAILSAASDDPQRSRRMLLSHPSPRFALAASCTRLARVCREARLAADQMVDMIYPRTLDDDEMTFTHLPSLFPLARFAHVYGCALKVIRVSPTVEPGIIRHLLQGIVDCSQELETLAFRDYGDLDSTLVDRVASLPRLTTLEVSHPSDAVYTALSSRFHGLKSLFLHHVPLPHVSRLRSSLDNRSTYAPSDTNQSLSSFFISVCMPVSAKSGQGQTGWKVRNELHELASSFRVLHEHHHVTHMSIVFDYARESEKIIETCFYNALGSTRYHFTLFHPYCIPPSEQRSIISKNSTHLDLFLCAQYIYNFSRIVENAHELLHNSFDDVVLRSANTLMMNRFASLNDFVFLPGEWQIGCFEFLRHAMPQLSMLKIGQFTSHDNMVVSQEWDIVNNLIGLALQILDQITAVEIPWAFLSSFKFHSKSSYMKSWSNIREIHLSSLYYAMGSAFHHVPDACALTAIANFFAVVSENCPHLQVINLQSSDCSACNCINKITFHRQNTWEITVSALRKVYLVLDHITSCYSHHVDIETVCGQLLEWEHIIEFARPQSTQRLYRVLNDI